MLLHDHVDRWARERPDGEFAVQRDRCLTWAQAKAASESAAGVLRGIGLEPGDRCAVLARNSIEYLLLYVAASRAGVVLVPLDPRSAPTGWDLVVADATAMLLVHGPEFAGVRLPAMPVVGLDELCAPGKPRAGSAAPHPGTRELLRLYTGGTTGAPKGASLPQEAVTAAMAQIAAGPHGGRPGERTLVVAPLSHAGVVWSALAPLAWGASLVIADSTDPAELVALLDEQRIGYAALVPVILAGMVDAPGATDRSYPALRLLHTGSAPASARTLRRAAEVFGCAVVQGYGLTETAAAVSTMTPADTALALCARPDLLGSVGRALPGTRIRVVDAAGRPLPAGATGEVVVSGPQLMTGYAGRPDATRAALRRGWLHTGDVGHLDPEGYLHLTDRLTDVIVSGGVNIWSAVVEQALCAHPAVAEAAVIGIPDARWGETVHAAVVLRSGAAATEDELIAFCRARLGGVARPRSVAFLSALPRHHHGEGAQAGVAGAVLGGAGAPGGGGMSPYGPWIRAAPRARTADGAPVRLAVDGPVATITFDRPEKLNAADLAQCHALEAAVAAVGAEPGVRVVLLRGAGRSFGTGIDRDMLANGMPPDFLPSQERAYAALEDMDKLVIGVLHGHVLGAGLLAALACDLRICSTDAVLGLLAARYGLFPALGTFRLPRLIGLGPARRLILSGETVDPTEAHRLGLVDHLVAAERFPVGVDELVAHYVALSPAAVVAIKHLTARVFDVSRDTALTDAVTLLTRCLAAPDVAAASAAWRSGRRELRTTHSTNG